MESSHPSGASPLLPSPPDTRSGHARRCVPRAPAGTASPRAGLPVVELSVMMAILMVGLLAFSHSVRKSMDLGVTSRESTLATEGCRSIVERMQGHSLAEIHPLFNQDPDDDPAGPGTAPGRFFAVEGLRPRTGDADGFVGEIVFPTFDGFDLREDVNDDAIGMPRDLDLDGVIDSVDHSGDYRILPVLVRLEWRGETGDREMSFKTILAHR